MNEPEFWQVLVQLLYFIAPKQSWERDVGWGTTAHSPQGRTEEQIAMVTPDNRIEN